MKPTLRLFCLFALLTLSNCIFAGNRFWVAAGASNWNNTANWSNASGGGGGSSVPVAADAVTFDGNGLGNCSIDVSVGVTNLTVAAAYTGTISQGANTIAASGTASFAGGIFTGGTANMTITGVFTLSGTAFTSTSAILELQNNAAFTGGSFVHNNGRVRFNDLANENITGNSPTFFALEFVGNGATYTISSAGNMVVLNSLNLTGIQSYNLNTGTFDVQGDINSTNTNTNCGGTALVLLDGAGVQNFMGNTTPGEGAIPQLTINKASGTLNLSNFPAVSNNFIYTAGTVSPGTSTLCFTRGSVAAYSISGTLTLANLSFDVSNVVTATINAGTTITTTGDFTMAGPGDIILNTGNINVNGNIFLQNTGAGAGGTATITILGAGNENMDGTAIAVNQSRLPVIVINKPAGTLSLLGNISFASNLTYTAGLINPGTAVCYIVNNLTITGSFSLTNLTVFGAGNTALTIAAGTTVTVTGTLDLESTNKNININTGTIEVTGNIVDNNSGLAGGGSGTILIDGAGAQSITSTGVINQGTFPLVTINKASGTLTFPSLITVVGNWTYTSGTLDVTTNNATIVFAHALTITGTLTLNNLTFESTTAQIYTVSTGTVLTVTGTLSTTGISNNTINTPVLAATAIQAQGNIAINNTGAGGGGTGTILINGAGAQALTSTAASGQGRMPNITIQKVSGTLTLSGIISESRNWTYTSGTVDATTNATTVVFSGNNLNITSAGMSFYNVTIPANTITLLSSLTANNNVTISGLSVLAPGANTINLAGNWSDWGTGLTAATSTVNFNGSSLQTITDPAGENFTNLTVNNSGTGIQLENNATVATTLTMTLGNIDLNGNTLTLGLSVANNGTLVYSSGTVINTGTFTRWFKAVTIAAGSVTGLFPMGTATDYRPFYVSAPASGPTTGGTIAVSYTDATTNTTVAITDGASTIVTRKDLNWNVATANGLAGGTYNLQVQGTGFGTIGAVSDLRLSLINSVVGTAGVNAGTTTNPQVNRTGLAIANLANAFYIGSINAVNTPLPITLTSFTATVTNREVELDWSTAMEMNNSFFTIQRSKDAAVWENLQQVAGIGTSNTGRSYTAYDLNPYPGISYYRLIQTDLDGTQTYSAVKSVNVGDAPSLLTMYPNPAIDQVIIHSSQPDIQQVVLFNSNGERMNIPVAGSWDNQVLFVANLASGIYFVRISHKNFTETRKLTIRK